MENGEIEKITKSVYTQKGFYGIFNLRIEGSQFKTNFKS